MLNLNKFMPHSISMGLVRNQPEENHQVFTLTIPNWPNCKKIKSQFQVLCVKNVFISISVGTPFC